MLPTILPAIIPQQSVKPFNFYFSGKVCKGMNYQGKLYRFCHIFQGARRAEAFALACKLSAQGAETLITVSQEFYSVWLDLRSANSLNEVNNLLETSLDQSVMNEDVELETALNNLTPGQEPNSLIQPNSFNNGYLFCGLGQLFEQFEYSWGI